MIQNLFIGLVLIVALGDFCFERFPKTVSIAFVFGYFQDAVDHIGSVLVTIYIHKREISVCLFSVLAVHFLTFYRLEYCIANASLFLDLVLTKYFFSAYIYGNTKIVL